jgi:hypothetical protein
MKGVRLGIYNMSFLKLVKENSEYIIGGVITLLPSIMSFILKQLSQNFEIIRKEKVVKRSKLGKIMEDRINYTFIQLLCYIPVIILIAIIIYLLCYFLKLKRPDPNFLLAFGYIIYLIMSELFVKQLKNNRKVFLKNISKSNILKKLKNILLFYSTSALLNLCIFIVILFRIHSNLQLYVIEILAISIPTISSLMYFNSTVYYNRYSFIKLHFNNSYPVLCCEYENISINDSSYIIVSHINEGNDQIKYNNNIIAKIEYVSNDKIEDEYKDHLAKSGFIN